MFGMLDLVYDTGLCVCPRRKYFGYMQRVSSQDEYAIVPRQPSCYMLIRTGFRIPEVKFLLVSAAAGKTYRQTVVLEKR